MGHFENPFFPPIRTIRWMPTLLQEACQFHSPAVKRGFSGFEILFRCGNCSELVKIPVNGKNSTLRVRHPGEGRDLVSAAERDSETPAFAGVTRLLKAGAEQRAAVGAIR
jgi:hypothetical protein